MINFFVLCAQQLTVLLEYIWMGDCSIREYVNLFRCLYLEPLQGLAPLNTLGKPLRDSFVSKLRAGMNQWCMLIVSRGQTTLSLGREKKGLVQFESHNCLDVWQSYVHHNKAPCVLKLCYNRLHLTTESAYLLINQQFIPDSQTLKLTFIYLAVHDGNWLTQALLFENPSHFFG